MRQSLKKRSWINTTMAESNDQDDGQWWGGWWQTAKEKSSTALEFMKKDFSEFSNTIQKDTSTFVASASEKLKENFQSSGTSEATSRMKEGVKTFLDGISHAVRIEPDDSDQEACVYSTSRDSAFFDRTQTRIHYIQIDPETYINEPTGPPEQFQIWQESFDMENMKGDLSELLVSKVEVRALYTKLVPAAVSHSQFWQRYFYRIHQLHIDEQRKKDLMKRADATEASVVEDDWSGDEDTSDGTQLPSLTSVSSIVPEMTDSDFSKTSDTGNTSNADSTCMHMTDKLNEPYSADGSTRNDESHISHMNSPPNQLSEPAVVEKFQEENEQQNEMTKNNVLDDLQIKRDEKISQCDEKQEIYPDNDHKTASLVKDDSIPVDKKDDIEEFPVRIKGDIVVVGSDGTSSSTSTSSNNKDSTSEDWEKDFDIELAEEDIENVTDKDLKLATGVAKKLKESGVQEDDWENWE